MKMIQEKTCDVSTLGLGKVFSAGVPILASGTKGKRNIAKNCRVMIHNVSSGVAGTLDTMENEIHEIRWIEDSYINCLVENTKLTEKKLRKMLNSKKEVYISAEQAIKLGIADNLV